MPTLPRTAADTIRAARLNAGLSQRQLAQRLSTSHSRVVAWESGRGGIHPRQLRRLCDVLGLQPGDVLGRAGKHHVSS